MAVSTMSVTQKVLDECVVELPSEEDLFIPANIKETVYVPYFADGADILLNFLRSSPLVWGSLCLYFVVLFSH